MARRIHDEALFVQTLARKLKYFDRYLVSPVERTNRGMANKDYQ